MSMGYSEFIKVFSKILIEKGAEKGRRRAKIRRKRIFACLEKPVFPTVCIFLYKSMVKSSII